MYVLVNLNLASEAELAKKRFHLNFLHLRVCVGWGGGGGEGGGGGGGGNTYVCN